MKKLCRRLGFLLPIPPVLLLHATAAAASSVSVIEELNRLAEEHDFTVVGLENADGAVGRADRDELYPRLRRLLENFDHVIVQAPDDGVERVIIMGVKVPFVPTPPAVPGAIVGGDEEDREQDEGDIVLKTVRTGTQHSVNASLEGAGEKRVARALLVDTGADFVVLPATMVKALGISPNDLTQREMQTANGKVTARIGTIPAIWLGSHRIDGVEVAFIEDSKLGGSGLLGMSVLGRFTMTIDDDENQLTLGRKQ